jgi:hypothetical protein
MNSRRRKDQIGNGRRGEVIDKPLGNVVLWMGSELFAFTAAVWSQNLRA